MKKYFLIIGLYSIISGCIGPRTVPDPPSNLKCEYTRTPLGIDVASPRLFWEISNSRRGTRQSAYQILVSTKDSLFTEAEADVWNSGKVKSNRNIQIEYQGKALESGNRYFWKVKFWDENGTSSDYCPSSWWETGLMNQTDWKGDWIFNGIPAPESEADMYKDTPAPLFRKTFEISKQVKSARLYITGLGYYESFLNGTRIGDRVLDPGWTNYEKTVQYSTYDVSQMIRQGENAMGVMVGNGWYNPLPLYLFNRLNLRKILTIGQPKFIAQLNIVYSDGTGESIVSDESWKTSGGPILMNNVYLGEKYDARLEQEGWNEPGFDESKWGESMKAEAPGGELVAEIQPPIRITKLLVPVKLTQPAKGVYIFDMGQNFAGVARITLKGPAGTKVRLRYGELLHEDGTLDDRSTIACHIMEGWYVQHRPGAPLNANQTDTYILNGKGDEVYHSRFTFHGFRYVEMTGFPGVPTLETLEGLRMNSDIAPAGKFECSNPLFNKIQENANWTFLSNVFSIESDCPGREKFGYGGDIVTASEAYMLNYDMSNFYAKAVKDFSNDQRPGGGMPECAPDNAIYDEGLTADTGPIGWMLGFPWMQQKLYQYYGDRRIIEQQYEPTKKLIEFIRGNAPDHLVEKGISDHATIAPKPFMVTGTAFYYDHVKKLADFARILEKTEEAEKYSKLAVEIKDTFNRKLVDQATGRVDSGTQASQAFALYYNLLPENLIKPALDILENDIVNVNGGHISAGIFGTKNLFEVLRRYNRNDLAYTINNQKTVPSYGYMIENGATTIWENWKGGGSYNHPMFGSVSEWFYKSIGGISPAEDAVGFDRIIIHPFFSPGLEWMQASYHSIQGIIETSWIRNNGKLTFKISIPGNTEARVYFPVDDPGKITENGIAANKIENLKFLQQEEGYSVFSIGPGKYSFVIE